MDTFTKFLLDYFQFKFSSLLGGIKNYEAWKAKNYQLKTVELKNSQLAKEIEAECKKKGGFLTYEEFLNIDQFGASGYHSTHNDHGMTATHKRWGKVIAKLCQQNKISQIIEFGPGNGNLARETLRESQKNNFNVKWCGVELNQDLGRELKINLEKHGFGSNIMELVPTLDKLKTSKKSIVVFSYSLDSVPLEIFLNTGVKKAYPDSLIGITVDKGILHEIILSSNNLRGKGIIFRKGIYQKNNGYRFDLNNWMLYPGQKAYVCLGAFSILASFASRFPDSMFVIIDEVRPTSYPWETGHLCVPKDLHRYKRDIDIERGYREAGNNLLYYPTYFLTLYKLIHSLGFHSIRYDIEQRLAKDIMEESFSSIKGLYATYAFLAQNKSRNQSKTFRLEFPQTKLL